MAADPEGDDAEEEPDLSEETEGVDQGDGPERLSDSGERDESHQVSGTEVVEDGDDDSWRFSLEEIDARQDTDGNVAGDLARNQPLEPGEINRENALFVALGVLLVVVLIAAVVFGF